MCYISYRRTWNITSLPKCWLSSWGIWCSFLQRNHCIIRGFSQWTARGFYPWGNVVSPCERVAEGLCGWRHGNSFPMTQSAQSLRQMQSIPRCPKAVFLCFCFWFHSRFGNNASSIPTYFLLNPNSWLGVKHKKKEQRIRHSFFLCKSWKELLIS